MKTKRNNVAITVCGMVGMILVVMMALFAGNYFSQAHAAQVEQEPVVQYVEIQKRSNFDTSIIETQWCGGFENGIVRMVGAWWYDDGVIEDEQGQLWYIEQSIDKEDFLLLWIADNNTEDVEDDIIIKVWREAY